MKLAFVAENKFDDPLMVGVNQKIKAQIVAFEKSGIEVVPKFVFKPTYIKRLMPFGSSEIDYSSVVIEDDVDAIYYRHYLASWPLLKALKKWKRTGRKIIVELPSYPYDDEVKRTRFYLFYLRDIFYRRFLKKYVDILAVNAHIDSIWGIPARHFVNGVECSKIKLRDSDRRDETIDLLIVANVSWWHGVDRLIDGLNEYYNSENPESCRIVKLHIVGESDETKRLRAQVEKYGLGKYVIFYGTRVGNDLDNIYDIADICVDSLGLHRKNLDVFGTIKSMEYIARGIPFIAETTVPGEYDSIRKYIHSVGYNDSYINISELVEYFDDVIRGNEKVITQELREFGESNCDSRFMMKEIVGELLG